MKCVDAMTPMKSMQCTSFMFVTVRIVSKCIAAILLSNTDSELIYHTLMFSAVVLDWLSVVYVIYRPSHMTGNI